jgi:hypothetical protein
MDVKYSGFSSLHTKSVGFLAGFLRGEHFSGIKPPGRTRDDPLSTTRISKTEQQQEKKCVSAVVCGTSRDMTPRTCPGPDSVQLLTMEKRVSASTRRTLAPFQTGQV